MTSSDILIRDNEPRKITLPEKPECNPAKWDELSKVDASHCRSFIDCPCHAYESALDRAFEEGVGFEDEHTLITLFILQNIKCFEDGGADTSDYLKDGLYHVSLPDYKEVRQWQDSSGIWHDTFINHITPIPTRTILRFIPQEPAEEKVKDQFQIARDDGELLWENVSEEVFHKYNFRKGFKYRRVPKVSNEEGSDGEEQEKLWEEFWADVRLRKSDNEISNKWSVIRKT